jgi:hypothetical protein
LRSTCDALHGLNTIWIVPALNDPRSSPSSGRQPGRCSRTQEAPPSSGVVSASLLVRGSTPSVRNHHSSPNNSKRPFRPCLTGTKHTTNPLASVREYLLLLFRRSHRINLAPAICTVSRVPDRSRVIPPAGVRYTRIRPSKLALGMHRRSRAISRRIPGLRGWL